MPFYRHRGDEFTRSARLGVDALGAVMRPGLNGLSDRKRRGMGVGRAMRARKGETGGRGGKNWHGARVLTGAAWQGEQR